MGEINPKDIVGATKPALRFVPPALVLYASQAYKTGALKYGPFSWRVDKITLTTYIEAAERHLAALKDGEDLDPKSGHPHAAHIAAGMGIILDSWSLGMLIDDRWSPGAASRIIQEMTDQTKEQKK